MVYCFNNKYIICLCIYLLNEHGVMACKLGLNHLGLANPGMASCPQGKSRKGEEEGEEEEGNTEVEENKV